MTDAMTGAQATMEALSREGVRLIFGLPGTTIMDLIDAVGEHAEIRYIAVRHEQVAAFMADGYARGSGALGVCMASRGPGAANLSIGIHNAHAEAVPVLALVGQVPDALMHRDAFEEMDLLTFFAPVTKWAIEIHESDRIAELVQRACRTAVSGRPGAVLVSVPHDVQTRSVPEPVFQPRWRPSPAAPNPVDLEVAAQLLAQAERPVIVVGGGVRSHDPHIVELAQKLAAPVVTTWLRKGVFPSDSDNALGALGYGAVPVTEAVAAEADVVLALGAKFSEFSTNKWTLFDRSATFIHVDLDEHALGRVYVPRVGIQADASLTARNLVELIDAGLIDGETDPSAARTKRLVELRALYLEQTVAPSSSSPAGTVTSRAVLDALQAFVDVPDSALVADAPGFGTWIHRYMTFRHPRSFYGAAGGSMGWGFPAAMGLKLARPEARVVVVAGDGSFWMVAQDVETAVREGIAVVIVVMNNFAFGNTRDRQRFSFGERYNGVFYRNPDFAEFARMLGAHGERVESDEQFAPALERSLAAGRPAIIDVLQDRMEGLPAGLVPPGVKRG